MSRRYLPVVVIEIDVVDSQSLERFCTRLPNVRSGTRNGRFFTRLPLELESNDKLHTRSINTERHTANLVHKKMSSLFPVLANHFPTRSSLS